MVTADPSEGESLTETGTEIVEAVAMPAEIQRRLAAFVTAHHVERPFIKRKRDRADPEAMARGAPILRRRNQSPRSLKSTRWLLRLCPKMHRQSSPKGTRHKSLCHASRT